MNCKQATYWFPDALDSSLPHDVQSEFDTHLSICASCRTDLEELREILAACGNIQLAEPPAVYWGTILPRIHDRIESKTVWELPAWITRLVLPMTAVTAIVLFSFTNYPFRFQNDSQELAAIVHQLPSEDVQQLEQNEYYGSLLESSGNLTDKSDVSETDKDVVKQLLKESGAVDLYSDLDYDVSMVPIDEHDTDELLSRLKQQPSLN